jgi:alpha-galactosidase
MSATYKARRQFLQWAGGLAGAAIGRQAWSLPDSNPKIGTADTPLAFGDAMLHIEFDADLRSRIAPMHQGRMRWHTAFGASEFVELADGRRIERFARSRVERDDIDGVHGKGTRLTLAGRSREGLHKTIDLRLHDRHPGFAFLRVAYRNDGPRALAIKAWTNGAHACPMPAPGVAPQDAPYWTYSGSTYPDRRDWIRPVKDGFAQENFLGMTASDYGGGTPIVDLWRADGGLALGLLEPVPHAVSLPVRAGGDRVRIALTAQRELVLAPGESLETLETFLAVHRGDYFAALDSYRRVMAERGVRSPVPPEASYEGIWCAWGYERQCTSELIEATLPKARELGLRWAVIDDGWQAAIGDWRPDPKKYPHGDADMKRLVASIRAQGLKPRLWYSPLSVAPGSDQLHEHADMLLLDKDGAVQNITWWNTFTLCPAYAPTVEYTRSLVRRFIGEWGFAGLKIDGQHLNGVAPCYNPAHGHARPEESLEHLRDLFHAIYDEARQADAAALVELCPCGTSYSFYDFPYVNQVPASDPESSWQVRLKGKTLKALMGPSAPFAGDHVELSEHGEDFASTVGVGAVVSTKFTWPVDPKPKDSFLLTPEREAKWRHWIGLYNEKMLPKGTYLGELYDIGFDRPEAHAVERSGAIYYAFYAPHWRGPVDLRGLAPGTYRLRDYVNGRELGEVSAGRNRIEVEFSQSLLLEAVPA